MDDWLEVRLGDLITVRHGWPFKSELCSEDLSGRPIVINIGNYQYTGGFRFDSTNVREYRGEYPEEYELSPGEILLVMTCQTSGGEILGIPACVPDDRRTYLHNQRLGRVVVTRLDLIDNRFLYWLFLSPSFNRELFLSATGTKILHTAPSRIEAVRFCLPSLPEQRAIAHILGTLDDKIELNRRMNETLEAMARGIFKSWFVDFNPVRAKTEGRDPGLPEAIANLFSDSLEDSELGEIPAGWEVRSLDEIAHYLNGLALQKFPPNGDESLPAIKIAQLRAGHTKGADRVGTNLPPEYVIEDGDVIFSWSGSLEVEVWCGGRGALNQHLFKVTSAHFPKWFYYLWTRHHLSDFQDTAANKATTMGHIQRQHLTEAKALVPPSNLLEAMNQHFAPLIDKLIANRVESQTLAALRDTLLPRLLSGELPVPEGAIKEGGHA